MHKIKSILYGIIFVIASGVALIAVASFFTWDELFSISLEEVFRAVLTAWAAALVISIIIGIVRASMRPTEPMTEPQPQPQSLPQPAPARRWTAREIVLSILDRRAARRTTK